MKCKEFASFPPRTRRPPGAVFVMVLVSALLLAGCATVGYYVQSARGQIDLLWKRESIDTLLQDQNLPPELRAKLERVREIRTFASDELGLPDNASYRSYADIRREYAVWTVYAAPEFSLSLREWCFPIAGCVRYRGYFTQEDARAFSDGYRATGDDVYIAGVEAYSTLGWFDDPVLNTFLRRKEPYLAGLVFHELAHQVVYVKNDSAFNEGFARTVELDGVRRWLAQHGTPEQLEEYLLHDGRRVEFTRLIDGARAKLSALYASEMPQELKRTRKQELFAELIADYRQLKQHWRGYDGYDAWFGRDLNNAKLGSVATYADYVPMFQALLRAQDGDLKRFYAEAKVLGALPADERKLRLAALHARD